MQDKFGARGGGEDRWRVRQVRPLPGRVGHGHGVVDGYGRPLRRQAVADGQARRIPDVVAVRLERHAEDRHARARQRAPGHGPGQRDDPLPPALIDRVHRGEQADHRVDAEVGGRRPERPDVLRQAPAAEPEPRRQEPPADPGVVPERLGQRHHVGARRLADLSHGVDERDLGRQERVRRHLDQLGRLQVHDQQRDPGRQRRGVDLPQQGLGARRGHPEHDAVGGEAVLHGEPLAQELRIPGQLDPLAGRRGRAHPAHHLPGRPDRDGRLPHDQALRRQVRGERARGGVDEAEVGLAGLALRRADAQEVDLPELRHLGERHGEAESAGVQVLPEQRFQAGFEERCLALRGLGDLVVVYVDGQHFVAEVRHADGVGQAEVSGSDDGDPGQRGAPLGRSRLKVTLRRLIDADVWVAVGWPLMEQTDYYRPVTLRS